MQVVVNEFDRKILCSPAKLPTHHQNNKLEERQLPLQPQHERR